MVVHLTNHSARLGQRQSAYFASREQSQPATCSFGDGIWKHDQGQWPSCCSIVCKLSKVSHHMQNALLIIVVHCANRALYLVSILGVVVSPRTCTG